MSTNEKDAELEIVLGIARGASDIVRGIYESGFDVELKGPNDPVTRADREANTFICEALARAFPGDGIVAEESVPKDEAELARLVACPRVWFVDPLDGTREFTERIGEFAVMVGLAEAGRATLGVVLMPTTGDAFCGRSSGGAFVESAGRERRALAVSAVADPRLATMIASRSHLPPVVASVTERLGVTKVVPCGSVGVKVSRIATGAAELYVHGGRGPKHWDTCAPEAILIGAGGRFTELSGRPIDYTSPRLAQAGGILATNAVLYEATLAITKTLS